MEIFLFESVDGRWWTDDWSLLDYKLTFWAFGSGELINLSLLIGGANEAVIADKYCDSSVIADKHSKQIYHCW